MTRGDKIILGLLAVGMCLALIALVLGIAGHPRASSWILGPGVLIFLGVAAVWGMIERMLQVRRNQR